MRVSVWRLTRCFIESICISETTVHFHISALYQITCKGKWGNLSLRTPRQHMCVCVCVCLRVCRRVIPSFILCLVGTRWCSRLRHFPTSRNVAGSIPDGVTGIFHWHNSSRRTVALGVNSAPKRNEYQEYFLRGKGGRCVGLTNLPPSCAKCLGTLRACPGL
jgi:hypothetical protein